MDAIWTAIIALASAVIVKVLDWIFSRKDKKQKALDQIIIDISSVRAELRKVDMESTKNYLVMVLSDIEKGKKMDEIESERFWEQYRHYVDAGGNSYIKRRVEKYKDEGLI